MNVRTRIAITLLVFTVGWAGCDATAPGPLPVAPSPVTQPPTPQPTPNFEGYTLTLSTEIVSPGGELTVSWIAPKGGQLDWIGIFSVGARTCDPDWYEYTKGGTSGALKFKAPSRPGQYEFRYYLDDSCLETARSGPVTVSEGLP